MKLITPRQAGLYGRRTLGASTSDIVGYDADGNPVDAYGNIVSLWSISGDTPASSYGSGYESAGGSIQTTGPSDSGAPWWSTLVDKLPSLATFVNSQQLAQENVRRAQAGLPPLRTDLYGPQVAVGVNPQTTDFLIKAGVGIGLGMIALKMMGKGKRR